MTDQKIPVRASDAEIDARIEALCGQRNDAMDRVAVITGQLVVAQKYIEEQSRVIAALQQPKDQKGG